MNRHTSTMNLRHQSGVVLIVALVMLVVIGLASVAIMRNTLSNDIVADNNRVQAQAMQAAQAALRYCEGKVQANDPSDPPQAAAVAPAPESWTQFTNWSTASPTAKLSGTSALLVPSNFVSSTNSNATQRRSGRMLPQCMAQVRSLGSDSVVVVSARGFSDNYEQDAGGHTSAGSVVWLQSIIKVM